MASQHLEAKAEKFKNALRGYMGKTLVSRKNKQKALANMLEAFNLTPAPHKKERYKTVKVKMMAVRVTDDSTSQLYTRKLPQFKSGQQQVQNPTSVWLCNHIKGIPHFQFSACLPSS